MSIMECCRRVGISPISYPTIILGEKEESLALPYIPLPHALLESMFIHKGSLIRPIRWYLRTNQ